MHLLFAYRFAIALGLYSSRISIIDEYCLFDLAYIKPTPKCSSANSTHIITYISPAETCNFLLCLFLKMFFLRIAHNGEPDNGKLDSTPLQVSCCIIANNGVVSHWNCFACTWSVTANPKQQNAHRRHFETCVLVGPYADRTDVQYLRTSLAWIGISDVIVAAPSSG